MPRYDFRCPECSRTIEILVPIAKVDTKHPRCTCHAGTRTDTQPEMTRLISAPRHEFLVPPQGRYYESIGKFCNTEAEFYREADKVLRKGGMERAS